MTHIIRKVTIQHKQWDSQFFAYPVGELFALCDADFLNAELQKAKADGYQLLYWRIDSTDKNSYQIAQALGLKSYDTKLTFQLSLSDYEINFPSPVAIQKHDGNISESFINLGLQSGRFSRFKKDKHFPEGTFEKMYAEWIQNSFSPENADAIFIASEEHIMKGFVTIFNDANALEIVLIAVEPEARKKGFATALIKYISNYAKINGMQNIFVVTQEANIAASNLYLKCGFTLIKKELIYHIWL